MPHRSNPAKTGRSASVSYYDQLIAEIGKSMEAHPHSTMVMDYGTRKIVAAGANPKKLSQKVKTAKSSKSVSIVFQRPKDNAIWILANS